MCQGHTLRKTWGYHQRVSFNVGIPELMVCFHHSTQRQTLDYLCIQPEEIKSVYLNVLWAQYEILITNLPYDIFVANNYCIRAKLLAIGQNPWSIGTQQPIKRIGTLIANQFSTFNIQIFIFKTNKGTIANDL